MEISIECANRLTDTAHATTGGAHGDIQAGNRLGNPLQGTTGSLSRAAEVADGTLKRRRPFAGACHLFAGTHSRRARIIERANHSCQRP
jgi:hypothetical protein